MVLPNVSSGDPHVAAHNAERADINANATALAGKITKPSTPQVGSLLRYNGSTWVESTTRLFEGTGSPEGVVAAPKGSRYVVTGGSTAIEWLKATGADTDNTGWIMLAGDTGWRNISGLMLTRSTGTVHAANLRRVGDVVDLYIDMTMPSNDASPYKILDLPPGFQPEFQRYGGLQDNREGAANSTSVGATGDVNLYTPHSGVRDRWCGVWTTKDSWPTSLPGSAL
jgi:hypothetical protein